MWLTPGIDGWSGEKERKKERKNETYVKYQALENLFVVTRFLKLLSNRIYICRRSLSTNYRIKKNELSHLDDGSILED